MKYILIPLLIILASCLNGLGPIDETILKPVTDQPNDSIFIGTWSLDSSSYDLIKEKYKNNYRGQEVKLIFKSDKSFEAFNIPDFVLDDFGEPVKNKFHNAQGTWLTRKAWSSENWVLGMDFKAGALYQDGNEGVVSYNIYAIDSNIVLNYFIGDPDGGDRLRFVKVGD